MCFGNTEGFVKNLCCTSILAQPTAISQTIRQLRQFKTNDYDTRVPDAARPLLTLLKQQLLNLIELLRHLESTS